MARPCRRRCDGRHRWPKNLRRCRLPPCSRPPGFLSSAASAPQGHHRVDDFGLETLAFLFGALMLGGTVKGIVGIAYPMVAVSMMSSVIEVPTAVVLVILPSVASNLLQSGVIRGSWGRPPHLESGGHPPVAPRGSRGRPPHLGSGGYPPGDTRSLCPRFIIKQIAACILGW